SGFFAANFVIWPVSLPCSYPGATTRSGYFAGFRFGAIPPLDIWGHLVAFIVASPTLVTVFGGPEPGSGLAVAGFGPFGSPSLFHPPLYQFTDWAGISSESGGAKLGFYPN